MKRLTLHRIASSLYRFIAFVAQLCLGMVRVYIVDVIFFNKMDKKPTQDNLFLLLFDLYILPAEFKYFFCLIQRLASTRQDHLLKC
jgi:hypothetical protein